MTVEKFGLVELERYQDEVGFKNGDVRTIKGVLAIVGITNAVVEEAENAIKVAKDAISKVIWTKEKLVVEDATDEFETKESIARIKADRGTRKSTNKLAIAKASTVKTIEDNDIKRLTDILKKFS